MKQTTNKRRSPSSKRALAFSSAPVDVAPEVNEELEVIESEPLQFKKPTVVRQKEVDPLPSIVRTNLPFLIRNGVPNSLIEDYSERQYKACMNQLRPFQYQLSNRETKGISLSKQREWLASMRDLSFDFVLLTGQNTDFAPNILALYLVHQELKNQSPPKIKWINATMHFHSPKPDEETYSLVVISNVAINSTDFKIDKVRDYLTMYYCPKILIAAGCDPIEFATKKLYKTPQYMLYFG